MAVILFSILLVAILIGNSKIQNLVRDIEHLKNAIRRLESGQGARAPEYKTEIAPGEIDAAPYPETKIPLYIPVEETPAFTQKSYDDFAIYEETDFSEEESITKKQSFEFNLGAKLPVWIGAICIIFAGFFMIRYSIENGLMGPGMRTAVAALSGAILCVAGYYISGRPTFANYKRISQGLAGAGLVLLYFTFYAATNMYHFISPTAGFIGMAAVTATAVGLSMLMGQAIAIFALAGGLLTPALMGSDEPNAVMLFAYLFVMSVGMLYMMARNGWWRLATFVVLGFFAWIGIWDATSFVEKDRWALVLFSIAIVASVLTITQKLHQSDSNKMDDPAFILNSVSIVGGFFTICLLAIKIQLSLFDWSMLSLLGAACAVLAHYKLGDYQKLLQVKLLGVIALFLFWMANPVTGLQVAAVISALSTVYILFPIYALRNTDRPDYWSSIQAVFALVVFAISFIHFRVLPDYSSFMWSGLALTFSAVFGGAVVLAYRMIAVDADMREKVMSIYALASTSFMSLFLYTAVPESKFVWAIAAQILALSCLHRRFPFDFLQKISFALVALFVILHTALILKFFGIFIQSLGGRSELRGAFAYPEHYLGNLAMCALLFGAAFAIYRDKASRFAEVIFTIATLLFCAFGYLAIKYIFKEQMPEAVFIERAVISVFLAVTGIAIFYAFKYIPNRMFSIISMILVNAVLFRLAWFDLMVSNPHFSYKQNVGELILINGVTLTYGGGCLLALWSLKKWNNFRKLYSILAMILLFAFVSLTVKQFYHGSILSGRVTNNLELYSYSIAWLMTSLSLLTAGLKKNIKQLRVAAMIFMILTIGKVFFIDAGELEGLYRIFSFLGLGICLIGLSFFYTRFISKSAEIKA